MSLVMAAAFAQEQGQPGPEADPALA